MNRFAALLDRLSYEPSRNAKLRLIVDYFRAAPDPDRGYALAALTEALHFRHAKPKLIKTLIAERVDPHLFALSYDYVGDLSETVALLWPAPDRPQGGEAEALSLSDVVGALMRAGAVEQPQLIAGLFDRLDETGRWALLKLITGALRVGVSARLAKQAVADFGGRPVADIEDLWHALAPPYLDLFAWLDGRAERPVSDDPAPFHSTMLAHALEEADCADLQLDDFSAEWKWDGVRVQAAVGTADGRRIVRLYSRTGEDMSAAFPDLVGELAETDGPPFTIDGELLILSDGRTASFNVLQQRLNRKTVSAKLIRDYPAHIRAYDLLFLDGADLRLLPFIERRRRLESFVAERQPQHIDLSPLIAASSWEALARARRDPAGAAAGCDAEAVEGIMLKRRDSLYVSGRPKGLWYKWKRDPSTIDAVLMYAQRGHGKRSSLYSDYTFGVWHDQEDGEALVPVGKAYFGFTDEELRQLDLYVRNNTVNRFGPVREVSHGKTSGLVLEIAFEGLSRSTRHKSGLAMRFPRINRIRWDKPAGEADRIETLEALLKS